MIRRNREFWYALAAIAATTALYVAVYLRAGLLPAASHLFGHGIGVLGFVLMLMTETLYSFRKRSTSARWGSMSSWLKFHMFTGMVGSYMVLLHPAMRFRGLAGVVTLLTLVVVISGLVGRYIYTAVPRALDGAVHDESRRQAPQRQLNRLATTRSALATWRAVHVPLTLLLFLTGFRPRCRSNLLRYAPALTKGGVTKS